MTNESYELYAVIRNGKLLKSLLLTVHDDGTLWGKPGPLLDGQHPGIAAMDRAELTAMVRSKRYDELPEGSIARLGISPTGMEVITYAEYDARKNAARKPVELTPAQRERIRIEGLLDRAAARLEDNDDNNRVDGMRLMRNAKAALEAWRDAYPQEAAEEDAVELEDKAARKEDLAQGALLYDADGWLDENARQERHDALMAEAAKLRHQADELRREAAALQGN